MRNLLRTLLLLLAVVSLSFLTSCEKDEFDSGSIESNIDHPTFSDLVTYGKDGSFSATLTGEEMAYILETEFGEDVSDAPQDLSRLFANKLVDNVPGSGKPVGEQKNFTTYGVTALIVTIPADFGPNIFDFSGIGGLTSATGTITASASRTRKRSQTFLMSAFSYVFDSSGTDYPFSRNDSSFDKNCPSSKPFFKGTAKATFSGPGSYSGVAVIACQGYVLANDQVFTECCD